MITKLPGFLYSSPTFIFRIKSVKSVKNVDEVFCVNQDQLSAKQSEKAICRLADTLLPPSGGKGERLFSGGFAVLHKTICYLFLCEFE